MFGFGKKNKKNISENNQILASEILEILHKTVEHELKDIDEYFKKKLKRNHTIIIPAFYTSKVYLEPDYLAYFAGFIEGYLQNKNLAKKDIHSITIFTVGGYSKTIVNYRNLFLLSPNEGEWSDAFMNFLSDKIYDRDEEARTQMMYGMAEGSAISKTLQNMTEDYSSMLDPSNNNSLDLSNLRKIIKTWSSILLLDREKLNYLKALYLENGEYNPNFEEDWARLNEEDGLAVSSANTPSKTQKSISKFKNNCQELQNFIENYEFKIKDDEDYYEHDITFDDSKKIVNVKIEVILTKDGPNNPYPFLDFKVDFNAKELISIDGISQDIDTFSDINDLKYAIEELIEKQY